MYFDGKFHRPVSGVLRFNRVRIGFCGGRSRYRYKICAERLEDFYSPPSDMATRQADQTTYRACRRSRPARFRIGKTTRALPRRSLPPMLGAYVYCGRIDLRGNGRDATTDELYAVWLHRIMVGRKWQTRSTFLINDALDNEIAPFRRIRAYRLVSDAAPDASHSKAARRYSRPRRASF
jgi:hypothetical protein